MENVLFEGQAVLATTAARWMNLADRLPADLLARAPAPGEWSALDCLRHLLDTEMTVFPVRLRAFLTGQDFAAFDPAGGVAGSDDRSAAQLAAAFARERAQNLAPVERLSPTDLARTALHPELGAVTLGQMLQQWAAHDLSHTIQAERAIQQPFIVGSGGWQRFFTQDVVRPAGRS